MEITRKEFEEKTLDELCEMLSENGENITTYESLKDFAKDKIDDDNLFLTIHICNALNLAQDFWPEANYYIYDYSMGTLETPSAVTCKDDIEHFFDFKDPVKIKFRRLGE